MFVPVRRRRAALAGLAVCVLMAIVALVVVRSGDAAHWADLGAQSDPSSLGTAVDAAIEDRGRGAPAAESSATCAIQTRESYGQDLGPLVYAARLRWQGVPAVALAYRVARAPGTGLEHRVFVVSTAGCQLLVAQSL